MHYTRIKLKKEPINLEEIKEEDQVNLEADFYNKFLKFLIYQEKLIGLLKVKLHLLNLKKGVIFVMDFLHLQL